MQQRSLGISAPEGTDVQELYLEVVSRPLILAKVANLIGRSGVDIIGMHGQVSEDKKTAYLVLYVEMDGSRVTTEELRRMLKKEEYVLHATSSPKTIMSYEDEMFPLTSGGSYRVFALGADSWVSLLRELVKTFGSGAAVILQNQGAAIGSRMVLINADKRFGGKLPAEPLLLERFKGQFMAYGLGVLKLSWKGKGSVSVRVKSSILSDFERSGTVDHFVVGLVKGALERIQRKVFTVHDPRYEDGVLEFGLEASPDHD